MSSRAAQRLQGVPTTIFTTMSQLAVRTGAVNLGQGFPDSDGPASVVAAAVEALRGGQNQYPPGRGILPLREAVARHQQRYGLALDPMREIIVTAGATEAIAAAVLGLVDPGDHVVVIEPYYDSYMACLEMVGARRTAVAMRWPELRLDLDALRAAVTDETKAIILNSPHNPTGAVLDATELAAVAEIAIRHDVLVITDEVYEHLLFDGRVHVPLATLPGMFERTVTISSAGKTFSFTGWKVGWATGPEDLIEAVLSAKQWLTFSNAAPLQPAIAHALDHEGAWVSALTSSLEHRRDLLCAGLADLGLEVAVPHGTYFALTDVSALGYADGMEFCLALPERAGVVAIPAQVFYDHAETGRHLVRWAFCKEEPVLNDALARLRTANLAAGT